MGRKIYPPGTFRNTVRAWRNAKNLTQERLVERLRDLGIAASTGSLSRIENGTQNFDAEILYGLAQALDCEPADLVMRNPPSPDQLELWSVIEGMSDEQRKAALRVLKAMAA